MDDYIFSDKGIPILTLPAKLAALMACLQDDYYEDAAGHLSEDKGCEPRLWRIHCPDYCSSDEEDVAGVFERCRD